MGTILTVDCHFGGLKLIYITYIIQLTNLCDCSQLQSGFSRMVLFVSDFPKRTIMSGIAVALSYRNALAFSHFYFLRQAFISHQKLV